MYIVIGGELETVNELKFRNPGQIEFVGLYVTEKEAYNAWKARAQSTVDNAHMRFIIVPVSQSNYV